MKQTLKKLATFTLVGLMITVASIAIAVTETSCQKTHAETLPNNNTGTPHAALIVENQSINSANVTTMYLLDSLNAKTNIPLASELPSGFDISSAHFANGGTQVKYNGYIYVNGVQQFANNIYTYDIVSGVTTKYVVTDANLTGISIEDTK